MFNCEKLRTILFRGKENPNPNNSKLFLITVIATVIIIVGEIIVGFCFLEKNEIKEVCSQLSITNCCGINEYVLRMFYAIVKYTSQSSIILMIVIFIHLTINWIDALREANNRETKKREYLPRALIEVLIGSLSASAIPTGISLIMCAIYDLDLIKYMSGVEIYIAFAGLSIISIAFLSTLRQQTNIEQETIHSPEGTKSLTNQDS